MILFVNNISSCLQPCDINRKEAISETEKSYRVWWKSMKMNCSWYHPLLNSNEFLLLDVLVIIFPSPRLQGELLSPCRCNGSVRCTHQPCLIRWISERGSWSCELCYFKYQVLAISTKNPLQVKRQPQTAKYLVRAKHWLAALFIGFYKQSKTMPSHCVFNAVCISGRRFLWRWLRRCRSPPSSWAHSSSSPVSRGWCGLLSVRLPSGSARTCSSRSATACTASWTLCA